jgi:hypothetical protein
VDRLGQVLLVKVTLVDQEMPPQMSLQEAVVEQVQLVEALVLLQVAWVVSGISLVYLEQRLITLAAVAGA